MSARERLSVFVTTFNSAATLARCLDSVAFADELVVLDSGSHDDTLAIARAAGARVEVAAFRGYGPQKSAAMSLCRERWALLLDADEWLTDEARAAILTALRAPDAAGYTLRRRERVFWQLAHAHARHNPMLRLVDRERARFSDDPVHAGLVVDGPVRALDACFVHEGEPDIHTKVAKINEYSTGTARTHPEQRLLRARMLVAPPWRFFCNYVLRRRFLSGWAGFIACVIDAFHVFLKYAKRHEARRRSRHGTPDQSS